MQSMQEECAGKLVTVAERILHGHPTLELTRRFRSLYDSHIYEKLSENDRSTVDSAAKVIKEVYGDQSHYTDLACDKRKAG